LSSGVLGRFAICGRAPKPLQRIPPLRDLGVQERTPHAALAYALPSLLK
jgi:hypothetical protein